MAANLRKQINQKLDAQGEAEMLFVRKAVPRLHRLIMEKFPQTVKWFNYSIARNVEDRNKLTILRGKKIIAKNF